MTISTRNRILGAGILFSAIPIVAVVLFIKDIYALYPSLTALAFRRSQGLIQYLLVPFFPPAAHASLAAVLTALAYAFISTGLIYYFFEKTQSPEILFFALFTASFSAEGARIVLPLVQGRELPQAYAVMAARILFFARQMGMFSIFMAGVYAAGLEFQKHGSLVLILAAVSLTMATGIPMDGLSWDSAMTIIPGYGTMFSNVDKGIYIITFLSFAIAAYTKGSREYMETTIGSVLVFIGRDGLLHADTWIAVPAAITALIAGTWLISTRLHRYYLWL